MPIKRCQSSGKPGYKWGNQTCYTYDPASKSSETRAKNLAIKQGVAIGEYTREKLKELFDLLNNKKSHK